MPEARVFDRSGVRATLIELALIVFGVLAALALQGWWEDRAEQQNLVQYLQAFEHEIQNNQEILDNQVEFIEQQHGKTSRIFELLASQDQERIRSEFNTLFGEAIEYRTGEISDFAYQDLVNSGNLRLVKNSELRTSILTYLRHMGMARRNKEIVVEFWNRRFSQYANQHIVMSNIGWEEFYSTNKAGEIWPETPPSHLDNDWESITGREFWNHLYEWKVTMQDEASVVLNLQAKSESLLVLLRSEIEKLQ